MKVGILCTLACAGILAGCNAAAMGDMNAPGSDPSANTLKDDSSGGPDDTDSAGSYCLDVDAMGMEACDAPQWVLCSDATCADEPVEVDGTQVVKCTCNIMGKGTSIIPASDSGAGCLTGLPGGDELCAEMNDGALYSSFGAQYTNPMPTASVAQCPPGTEWGYCWGAKCTVSDTNSDEAICDCPLITADMQSKTDGVVVSVTAASCSDSSVCDKMWNSGAAVMYNMIQQLTGPLPYCYDYDDDATR